MNVACIDIVFSLKIVTALPCIGLKKRMELVYKGTLELQALTVYMHISTKTLGSRWFDHNYYCMLIGTLLPSKTFWLQESIPAPHQA